MYIVSLILGYTQLRVQCTHGNIKAYKVLHWVASYTLMFFKCLVQCCTILVHRLTYYFMFILQIYVYIQITVNYTLLYVHITVTYTLLYIYITVTYTLFICSYHSDLHTAFYSYYSDLHTGLCPYHSDLHTDLKLIVYFASRIICTMKSRVAKYWLLIEIDGSCHVFLPKTYNKIYN